MANLKPIKTEADYQAALREVESLFEAAVGALEGDRLEVLVTLIEVYEQRHYPIEPPDPVEAILYYLEMQGLSRRDLEPSIGSRARVAEILNRKRALTLNMIRRLHQNLGIPASVLIQPYDLAEAS